MINTVALEKQVGAHLHIGAAANKMISVVRAIRDMGERAYLVSLPFLGQKCTKSLTKTMVLHEKGCPQIFLSTPSNKYARKFYSFISFAWFCFHEIDRNDKIIIYNHAIEYLLGVVILRLKRARIFMDIEDGPRSDELGFKAFLHNGLFFIFRTITSSKALVVSSALAKKLEIREYCVVHGAIARSRIQESKIKSSYEINYPKDAIDIHYGGSLSVETGIELFCEAVDILLLLQDQFLRKIRFVITGFGSGQMIKDLESRTLGSMVEISYSSDCTYAQYLELFSSCQIGLCLKLPESEVGMTTFPSKVVEITSAGLLLISTRVSDVPYLFNENTAVLLSRAAPQELAETILSLVNDPEKIELLARCGQRSALEMFESKKVGERIVNFICND